MTVSVLLVEDLQQWRAIIGQRLAGAGDFVVIGEAASEESARRWLQDNPAGCDLAVIDLVLEQGTGMGVIAEFKGTNSRVVVLSDYATPSIRKHCISLGAHAVFQKTSEMSAFVGYCAAMLA